MGRDTPSIPRRKDPIFGLDTPLLFAHRGGAREVPESTERAFRHAVEVAHADALELDVQVTRDDEPTFVVWHGPKLDNVRIEDGRPGAEIDDYAWNDLEGKAWVADPDQDPAEVEPDEDRLLLRLEDMLAMFATQSLNIELKGTVKRCHIDRFAKIVKDHLGDRQIVVVSQDDGLLQAYRAATEYEIPTGLSIKEMAVALAKAFSPFHQVDKIDGRAAQTSYASFLSPPQLIREVREAGGAVHVFLNNISFLVPSVDHDPPCTEDVIDILERGVDGIMTDRPHAVRCIINDWLKGQPPVPSSSGSAVI